MWTTDQVLLIRADAGTQIGTGHLMRCLALAQGWRARGGQVIFVTACASKGLLRRLADEGFQVFPLRQSYPDPTDWEITSQVLAEHPDAWVVLDGYHFDPAYQRQVKESGHRLLVIDDLAHLEHYHADLVLNQNIGAERLTYACDPDTRLLLGLNYVLLRNEFLAWQGRQREVPEIARKILVTLGGSDPDNVTRRVIRALQQVDVADLETVVVVGAGNPHVQTLQAAIRQTPGSFQLVRNVTDMPELMAWADIAVSAGGSTCWELAFMGLPGLIFAIAENQRMVVNALTDTGVFTSLAEVSSQSIAMAIATLMRDSNMRLTASKKGQQLIDGVGAKRVLECLK